MFCTSPEVTSDVCRQTPFGIAHTYLLTHIQLVDDLQRTVMEAGGVHNFAIFIPASLSAGDQRRLVEHEVQNHVDVFEDATDAQLYELYDERKGDRNWIESGLFAVLDRRSAKDRTTVIYCFHVDYRDDDGVSEEIGRRWVKWRVSFADAWIMIAHLTATIEIEENVYMQIDRFTGENGVFDTQEALRQTGYL